MPEEKREQFLSFQPQEISFREKKPKPKVFTSILILVLILFAGLIGILASRMWDPLWNPFRPAPERVIEKMFLEMKKIKTSQRKAGFSIKGENGEKLELTIKTEGKIDKINPENPKIEERFDLLFQSDFEETPLGIKFAFSGESKVIDNVFYIKFTKLPSIPGLEIIGVIFPSIRDQWIKIDKESLIEYMKKVFPEKWTPETERMIKESFERQKTFEKEAGERLEEILRNKKLFIVKKELPDEKIEGVKVYHYVISLNHEEIIRTIPEILKVVEETVLKEYGASPTIEMDEEFEKKMRAIFDKIGEIEGELWIGKKDYLLYRVKGKKVFDLSKLTENKEKGYFTIKIEIENSRFNQPVEISLPAEFKTIEEALDPLFQGIKKRGQAAADLQLKMSLNYLYFLAKEIYSKEKSYKNLCLNFTLNENEKNYGKDLFQLENDIKEIQGGRLKLSCYSLTDSYCVTADLVSRVGKFCLDSSGKVWEISATSSCIGGTSKDPYRCPEAKTEEIQPYELEFPLEELFLPQTSP